MHSVASESPTLTSSDEIRLVIPPRRGARDQRADSAAGSTPAYRVVILGAGRSVRGNLPAAMVDIDHRGCVLDWLLAAFSTLRSAEVNFVGGYMAHAVMDRYRDIRFVFNPDWAVTGPARSLSLAPLASSSSTYVSYSDVVFRPETVARMETRDADVVVAVDRQWRVRYEGRSRVESDGAEKVVCNEGGIVDIGKHVATDDATAEFAGLVRLSAATASRLQNVIGSGAFKDTDGLTEVIRFLIANGVSTAAVDVDGEWAELNAPQDLARFVLGTKAESLERLKPLVRAGHVGELVSFTHQQWGEEREGVLQRIADCLGETEVILRSSALSEDNWLKSSAGAYKSIPNLPTGDVSTLAGAVDEVFGSYDESRPENQVLVQEMLEGVTMSGVVMTRTPALGAPYYVINYDNTTSRTDTVTAGNGKAVRTLFVHRDSELRPGLPDELYRLGEVVRELERLVGHDSLDVEFAFTADGRAHVLQVRPIAVAHVGRPVDDASVAAGITDAARFFRELQKPTPTLVGSSTRLSVMSDWNPAEIIGTKPGRLAFSLYRYLITDEVWARQRAEYGYRDVRPCNLLVDILGHPYVDVRATFNSFIPASLPDELASRLLEHCLDHLSRHPELHDKVEFDVLFTCLTFDFDRRVERLQQAGFSEPEIDLLRAGLAGITREGIARCAADLSALTECERRFERIRAADLPPLERAFLFLEDARLHSIPLFAHLARGAFVAVGLLRSLSATGVTTDAQTDAFLASVRTVSSDMQRDARLVAGRQLAWDAFIEGYGHLRPGTYDITSPHYGSAPEEYLHPVVEAAGGEEGALAERDPWDKATRAEIAAGLEELGLGVDVEPFEQFLRQAIEGREFSKFVFTKNLSAALEALAEFGVEHFISREELADVRIQELFELRSARAENVSARLKKLAAAGRETFDLTQAVCLPDQIHGEADLVCFEQCKAAPNFVSCKKVRGPVTALSPKTRPDVDLGGKIVLTPNADPGFDWIFSRGIAGLVTMYGGTNSHMAIRAAEFQLPAATGIGELLYGEIAKAEMLELDCASRQIRVVR